MALNKIMSVSTLTLILESSAYVITYLIVLETMQRNEINIFLYILT